MPPATLTDLLDRQADRLADRTAFTFPGGGGQAEVRLAYGELRLQALAAAAGLRDRVRPNAPVVVLLPTGAPFLRAFFGAVYAGALPVPLPLPRHGADHPRLQRLDATLAVLGGPPVLVDAAGDALLAGAPAEYAHVRAATCLRVEAVSAADPADARPHAARPGDPAYLQFTSGSTGAPRGVVLTHANVLANSATIHRVFGHTEELVGVTWLPLHHDMGLVGHVIQPMWAGGQSVLMPEHAFLRAPLTWLAAVSRYRATSSGGPPFAFELCVRRAREGLDLDLSSWRNAYVGAEAVPAETLEAFTRAFEPYGFGRPAWLPCYGLAEATLMVAGGPGGWAQTEVDAAALGDGRVEDARPGAPGRTLLGYPVPAPDFEVRVTDADGAALPDGRVGEIVVRGAAVAGAYWNDAGASAATFGAGDAPALRTGDLGFVRDGRLWVTGRCKDVVIVRGENHYPEDLERTVRGADPALRPLGTACVGVSAPPTEALVVIQEIRRGTPADARDALVRAIRAELSARHDLRAGAVVLIAAGSLPRTTSGKVSRAACRAAFLEGRLETLAEWRDPGLVPSSSPAGSAPSVSAGPHSTSRAGPAASDEPAGGEDDAVAIVGMACRFPAGADDPGTLWRMLAAGEDLIEEVPAERWEADRFYDPTPAVPGKMNTRWGGWVRGVDQFDPAFFGVAPHEAVEMDPQQRLLLEVAWRALEDAGIAPERLAGTDTGVFVGVSNNDYLHLKIRARPGLEHFNAYSGLGNANSIAANRLSYLLDLRGPSMAVDTACSSSLTALHLAVESVRRGEARAALAGGVNLMLAPGATITLSQFGMMAPDGRCKVFDAGADGYVRSEGCALVVIKRLRDAVRDGDRVHAVIRGSAMGQDGRTHGITAPSGPAQRRVIERALRRAGVAPREVGLVEAHGTGTALGDPVEVEELRAVYGQAPGAGPCFLGSVKASLGHLESAAGIASVLKVVLALRHGQVPPQLHLRALNPRIRLEGSRLRIPTETMPWPAAEGPRRAVVSSFGFGGADVHMVLEEAPPAAPVRAPEAHAPYLLFPLSARSPGALARLADAWDEWLGRSDASPVEALVRTQAMRRAHLPHRAAILVTSRPGLRMSLRDLARAPASSRPAAAAPRVAFLFTGQGSQYPGAGRVLYDAYPVFREAWDRCEAAYAEDRPDGGPTLRGILLAGEDAERLTRTLHAQPALFALGYALACLWRWLGVEPRAVMGHSVGEYVAACVAGCCTPEEGMRLVRRRAELMDALPAGGAMLGVLAPGDVVRDVIAAHAPRLAVAAVNSPLHHVLSGPDARVRAAAEGFAERGVSTGWLRVSHAFHSELMDPVLDAFEAEAARVDWRKPRIPWAANLTGGWMADAPDAAYWRRHLRETVRFAGGIGALAAEGIDAFVEVGPGSTLASLAQACLPGAAHAFVRSLDRDFGARETVLRALGQLYERGQEVDWAALLEGTGSGWVEDVPGHPFQRSRYWIDIDPAQAAPAAYPEVHRAAASAAPTGDGADPKEAAVPPVFEIGWVRRPAPPAPPPPAEGEARVHWIVVGGDGAATSEVCRRLAAARYPVFRVGRGGSGSAFTRRGHERATGATRVDVPDGCDGAVYFEALNYLLSQVARVDARQWRVIHAGALDAAPVERATAASLDHDQARHGPADVAALVQGIVRTARALPLWIVTRGAQAVRAEGDAAPEAAVQVAQAPLWGLARTLFLEHPELRGGVLDLDPAGDAAADAEAVIRHALAPGADAQAAYRGGEPWIPQLVPADPAPVPPPALRGDGAYLVTGGLGGLGLATARWLAERGARALVLAGRTVPPPRAGWDALPPDDPRAAQVAAIRGIEALGASVETVAADVRDPAQVDALLEAARAGGRPLRGVVHAAGVNWFARVRALEREALLDALRVKVSAAWRLHERTRGDDLDLFVLYSSVSAAWGSVDLGHYTASNHFLDALAHHRRAAGLPALSVDWGPWAQVGMSAKESETQVLERLGFRLMPPERALAALERVLATGAAQAVVADVDWGTFQAFIDFCPAPAFFARVGAARDADGDGAGGEAERLRALPPARAYARLVALVRQQLSAVVMLEAPQTIDVKQRFNFMGMDSLMAIAFAARLESLLGLRLPTTLAYNHPTIQAVADHLYELLRGAAPGPGVREEAAAGAEGSASPEAAPDGSASGADAAAGATADGNGGRAAAKLWFPFVRAGTEEPRTRLFCFPYAGAGASVYRGWQAAGFAEVVPVQPPGREERGAEPPVLVMAELVDRLADALAPDDGTPFAFFGHSLGGLTAFELARELRRRGAAGPERLVLSGCGVPRADENGWIHREDDDAFVRALGERFVLPGEALHDPGLRRLLLPALRADITVLETYRVDDEPPLDVPLLALAGAADTLAPRERLLEWAALTTGDFSLRTFPGDHMFIRSQEPRVLAAIGEALRPGAAPPPPAGP
jgi:acyl transferase domain-containing protein/acyl-CoA synthetase (AMP-forming)/AMP-acid ligase II/surfactin synthase thioesterase subunit